VVALVPSVRIQAAELVEQEIKPTEVAGRLWVSLKSAHQWHRSCGTGTVRLWHPVARADRDAI
jgi:hypothetical protein